MDIFAHFWWSYILFYRHKLLRYALIFGVAPDLLSWGIYTIYRLIKGIPFGRPILSIIPDWVFTLYGITHSLFVFAFVFFIIWIIFKKLPIYLFPWLAHILMDIPTHTREFLGTPFLWPISDYTFPGISWASMAFMMANYSAIIILLIISLKLRKNIFLMFFRYLRKNI